MSTKTYCDACGTEMTGMFCSVPSVMGVSVTVENVVCSDRDTRTDRYIFCSVECAIRKLEIIKEESERRR